MGADIRKNTQAVGIKNRFGGIQSHCYIWGRGGVVKGGGGEFPLHFIFC